MKVLLIEDDEGISAVLKRGLEQAGFDVDSAFDGHEGLRAASHNRYGVIVLDIMLPGLDGWTICERLREKKDTTPILMLTARDAVTDRVRGLESGADDYLAKPFDFTEFLARVRALTRRDKLHKTRVIKVADLVIDTASRIVTRSGRDIALTPREFTLLEALAANEGRILSRSIIQERVWDDDESSSNTVDVYIKSLRKKIDADFDAKLIHTAHGVGYALRVPHPDGDDAVG